MGEYTPTTDEVQAAYIIAEHLLNPAFPVAETEACFDNWLAALKRDWQAEALEAAADKADEIADSQWSVGAAIAGRHISEALRARAVEVRGTDERNN